jgi:hypothetical protein
MMFFDDSIVLVIRKDYFFPYVRNICLTLQNVRLYDILANAFLDGPGLILECNIIKPVVFFARPENENVICQGCDAVLYAESAEGNSALLDAINRIEGFLFTKIPTFMIIQFLVRNKLFFKVMMPADIVRRYFGIMQTFTVFFGKKDKAGIGKFLFKNKLLAKILNRYTKMVVVDITTECPGIYTLEKGIDRYVTKRTF